jgi:hypothetical protein
MLMLRDKTCMFVQAYCPSMAVDCGVYSYRCLGDRRVA